MIDLVKVCRIQATTLCGVLISFLTGCSGQTNTPTEHPAPLLTDDQGTVTVPSQSALRQQLRIECLSARPSLKSITLPANVELPPEHNATITTPLAGRIRRLNVALGDHVRQGQVLAELTSSDMAQAYADQRKADDALALAQQSLERARNVHAAGGSSKKDVEAAQSLYTQALAEAQRAHTRLAGLGARTDTPSDLLLLKSPINGVVTNIASTAGALIPDSATAVMTVQNLEQVWISAAVPEDLSAGVAIGQPVDVTFPTAFPQQKTVSRLATIDSVIQPDSHRLIVHALVDNSAERLRPNLFATMHIQTAMPLELRIPPSAILMNNNQADVFVQVGRNRFQRRSVDVNDDEQKTLLVMHGLTSGDCIVTQGGILLSD